MGEGVVSSIYMQNGIHPECQQDREKTYIVGKAWGGGSFGEKLPLHHPILILLRYIPESPKLLQTNMWCEYNNAIICTVNQLQQIVYLPWTRNASLMAVGTAAISASIACIQSHCGVLQTQRNLLSNSVGKIVENSFS